MRTVSAGFRQLIRRIQPTKSEIGRARRHVGTIRRRLSRSFNLRRFVIIGSYSRDTGIRGYSDIDLLAVFPRKNAKWGKSRVASTTFLDTVRNDLIDRYPQTQIRRDQVAVVVRFAAGQECVDIVPGIFGGMSGKRSLYEIPDGNGGWMSTGPESHNTYLKNEIRRSRGKLCRTVQLIKYWRECRTPRIELSSFHLELLLASNGICVGAKTYTDCLIDAFSLLAERDCRGLLDPLGIAGIIPACKTEARKKDALRSVLHSREHAMRALNAELKRDIRESFRQWNIVFNGQFPSYSG